MKAESIYEDDDSGVFKYKLKETKLSEGVILPEQHLALDKGVDGYKLDSAKPDLDLVLGDFSKALREVGKVGTYGLIKYPPSNWLKVESAERRYASAMLRHYFEYRDEDGPDIDPESKLPHLAHAAWNALAALELYLRNSK
jgi:hypothetical protein